MLVTGIEIDGLDNHDEARVSVKIADRIVTFFCKGEGRNNLVHDALRQLRRMPEFRSGSQDFRLADELSGLAA